MVSLNKLKIENHAHAIARTKVAAAVQANHRAVELATERYARGIADFLGVLESQRSAYQSEDQLAQSESRTVTSLISLYKALGGGWPAPSLE